MIRHILFKSVRNNLLLHDCTFIWKNGLKTASWNDVIRLFELDCHEYDFKLLNKLIASHIYKLKLKKMKVSYAAQVLSQRVSSTMRFAVEGGVQHTQVSSIDNLTKHRILIYYSTLCSRELVSVSKSF